MRPAPMRRAAGALLLLTAALPAAAQTRGPLRPAPADLFSGDPYLRLGSRFAMATGAEGLFDVEVGVSPPEDVTGLTTFLRARRMVGYDVHRGMTVAMAGIARATRTRAYHLAFGIGSYGRSAFDLMRFEASGTAGRFRFDVRSTWFRDRQPDGDSVRLPGTNLSTPLRTDPYSEAEMHWIMPSRAIEIAGTIGGRLAQSPTNDEAWGYASAAYPLPLWSRRLALIGATGWRPSMPELNLRGGRFVSIGLRFAIDRRAAETLPPPGVPVPPGRIPGLEIEQGDAAGVRVIRISVPHARTVELRGDFTDWQARSLEAAGPDAWELRVAIEPGTYRVEMRVDGGDWTIPPGAIVVPDGFGGTAGLIEVR